MLMEVVTNNATEMGLWFGSSFGAICELSACMHRTCKASWTELKKNLVCFLVIYTRDEFDHPGRHLDKYIERMHSEGRSVVSEMQRTARKLGANRSLAFAVTHGGQTLPPERDPRGQTNLGLLQRSCKARDRSSQPSWHSTRRPRFDRHDSPRILFLVMQSTCIGYAPSWQSKRLFFYLIMMRGLVANDPSEMLTIGPRQFFEESCLAAPSDGAPCGFEGFHWAYPEPNTAELEMWLFCQLDAVLGVLSWYHAIFLFWPSQIAFTSFGRAFQCGGHEAHSKLGQNTRFQSAWGGRPLQEERSVWSEVAQRHAIRSCIV